MSRALELLVAQAEGLGCDLITLRALVEEAAEVGARRARAATRQASPNPHPESPSQ
jgi:hypothetical protein